MLTLRDVSDTDGDASNDVTNELLGSVLPEPLDDGEMDKEEATPLLPVHRWKELTTDRLGNELQKEVLYLKY